ALEVASGSYLHLFEYFCLFPIAGIAILSVKRWSIPIFLVVEIWVIISNFSYFQKLFQTQHYLLLGILITFVMLNTATVLYLLLSTMRQFYFDPTLRWWRAKPRYQKRIECAVNGLKNFWILNISITGVFIANLSHPQDEIV